MARHDYLDAYALNQGKIIAADTVHHITPTAEDPDRFYDLGNLIPVSRTSHDEIHRVYDEGGAAKKKLMSLLYRLVRGTEHDDQWEILEGVGGVKKF